MRTCGGGPENGSRGVAHPDGGPLTRGHDDDVGFVVGDKVFVGNSGGEMGVSGWIAALDVHGGSELWRAYATGSDAEVKIGPRFKPCTRNTRRRIWG